MLDEAHVCMDAWEAFKDVVSSQDMDLHASALCGFPRYQTAQGNDVPRMQNTHFSCQLHYNVQVGSSLEGSSVGSFSVNRMAPIRQMLKVTAWVLSLFEERRVRAAESMSTTRKRRI
jgi:hypothetical protein